ncbi:MAG: ABC transporter permease [Candidatus Tectomicrobia bacterium]|nr:ABC transporter permease [Candidatus Tectomicrobia bacterium]
MAVSDTQAVAATGRSGGLAVPSPLVILKKYYSVLLLIIVWEVVARLNLVTPFLLPSVSSILKGVYKATLEADLIRDTALTTYRALLSFCVALVIAVPIGISMARIRVIHWFFDPIVSIGFPTPKISFLPIFILWFGLFDRPKIFLATLACTFPIVTATYLGTMGVDKYLLWSARNMGTSENSLLRKVIFPATLPQVLNGAQIAMPISIIVVIVSEMLMGGGGLGNYIMVAQRFADSVSVFAGLLVISVLGYLLQKILEKVRALVLHWHEETQHESK